MSLGFVDCRMKTEEQGRMLAQKRTANNRDKADSTILIPYTFTDRNTRFLVGVLEDHDLGQLNAEPAVKKK